jgi:hypothetical protein
LALAAAGLALPAHAEDIAANPQIDYPASSRSLAGSPGIARRAACRGDEFAARALAVGDPARRALGNRVRPGPHRGRDQPAAARLHRRAPAEVLGPDKDRPIYIYCNNNFADDRRRW